ncbi:ATP-binding protein [Fusobacterium mortiferum]|uniref:ATP-binding protein n=1 Tax=Fusobacterium mortiferum TaxID=850 RepID=A0ABS2G5E8_FUSMR|nr:MULTISPECIES: ATP-binding protein [Fusobacterium]MBM6875965.1 ATP-binding protein [Fusobacterium mortiferum]MDO5788154.1 ATP-binding protein [Fusobacterium sp.]
MEVLEKRVPVCKYCGKEYVENLNVPANFPDFLKEAMRYRPVCDCEDRQEQKRREQAEKERQRQCLMNKVKKYKDISVIDRKFLDSRFENADMTDKHMAMAKKYAENFIKCGTAEGGILLYGGVGTGKTYATACICNELMDNGRTTLVMNLGLYYVKLRREWAEAENDVLNYVKTCDLLVIDDLGTENVSDFTREKMFNLIDTRYRANKPMIITTNLTPEEIEKTLGSRIADRIAGSCLEYEVKGKSKRKFDKKAFAEWLTA